MLNSLNRAFDRTNRVLGYVSAAFVVVMAVTVLYDVLARITLRRAHHLGSSTSTNTCWCTSASCRPRGSS